MKKRSPQKKKPAVPAVTAWLVKIRPFLKNPVTLLIAGAVVIIVIALIVLQMKAGDRSGDFVSKNDKTRIAAFQQMQKMDPATKTSIAKKLVRFFNDPNVSTRFLALDAIGSMHEAAIATLPALIKVFQEDKDPSIQEKAGRTIGFLGPAAASASPLMIASLKDTNVVIRRGAAAALAGLVPEQPEALAALREALKDIDPGVRMNALAALAALGERSRPAMADVIVCLNDSNDGVCMFATRTLAAMKADAKTALKPLLAVLTGGRIVEVKREAAAAIGSMGSTAAKAVPALKTALQDSNPSLRGVAAIALGQIGPSAEPAVPSLIKLLNDKESWIAQRSAEALMSIGSPEAVNAAEQYREKLKQ
jgi:HEAT repeat protein